jgi:hypothetical protein
LAAALFIDIAFILFIPKGLEVNVLLVWFFCDRLLNRNFYSSPIIL